MFITFEGPEGGGKTTQIHALAAYLREQGHDVLTTREPGGTIIGEQIRDVLMDNANTSMLPTTEILLFVASRAQIVGQVIRPHLEGGGVVLCDRYRDSTLAYQGYGHRRNLDELRTLNHIATGGLKPKLTFLLDLPVEEGLQRRMQDSGFNRLDAYQLEFHQRVHRGYHELAALEPARWVTINARQAPDAVQADIRLAIDTRFD